MKWDWNSLPISLELVVYGNTLFRWLLAAGVTLFAVLLLPIIVGIVRRRAEYFGEKRMTRWMKGAAVVLQQTRLWFIFVLSCWLGSLLLTLPVESRGILRMVTVITLLIQGAVWGTSLIQWVIDRSRDEKLADSPAEVTTVAALGFVGKLLLYAIVLLLILDNLGVDVTALVAGLGIGGIAVALAAQNILGDLFSSMSIVLDKPFVLGDFIIVGDMMGTVEKIGLKTTRIKSLSGEQLVFSNSDLLGSRIRNFKRMRERRVVFSIGVTYDTPREKLQAIPGMIQAAIQAQEQTRFDRAHFARFGDFALVFEAVYFMLVPDFVPYMDAQQAINLTLLERFEEAGIEFAFPTQTLYLRHESTPGMALPSTPST